MLDYIASYARLDTYSRIIGSLWSISYNPVPRRVVGSREPGSFCIDLSLGWGIGLRRGRRNCIQEEEKMRRTHRQFLSLLAVVFGILLIIRVAGAAGLE